MRVLFTSVDWTGHFFPMVPLGWALQSAGHEVRVLCSTGLAGAVERAGFVPVPLFAPTGVTQARMGNYLRAREGKARAGDLPVLHPLTGRELHRLDDFDVDGFFKAARNSHRRWIKDKVDRIEGLVTAWRPDLVVHDLSSVDGRVAADLADVPAVVHLWGLVADAEIDDRMDYRAEVVDGSFAEFGLCGQGARIERLIDPTPTSLAPPTKAHRIPARFVPYNGPGAMPDWVLARRDRPRVTVVWGTSVTRIYGRRSFLVPRVVDALAGLPVEAVLAVDAGDMADVGALPSNVRLLRERAPLRLLLEASDAVVHNGAAGSVMTSLAAGVPQLALSISDEQAGNGARVAAAGAGRQLPGPETGPDEIADAVTWLLEDPVPRAVAVRLAEENDARPAPAALVPELVQLAGGRRSAAPVFQGVSS